MAQELERDSQDRRTSSQGRGDTDTGAPKPPPRGDSTPDMRKASGFPTPVVTEPPGPPVPARMDRTLEVRGAAARVIARALDSTREAAKEGTTPPTSSDRLAMLAAHLPSIPRDAYVVGNQVAKGGIGRVMRARDERLDRPVAIKELLVWNEAQEQRFIREALLTARLQHPAIVPIYEAGRWPDGEPFYAMKLVSGRSLADLIAERKTLAERMSLLPHVLTAAQAIAYAHSQHIIHRDLKPANVLVGEFGETVVIDWGLAKDFSDQDSPFSGGAPVISGSALTIDGAVVGTPAYMPPEQAAGRSVDERADIYAIGAMLYHLIAAVPPHHDVPWDKMLQTIATGRPIPIEKHAPALSDELCAIVHKAMARSPEDRYPTAKELADDLQRFQTGQIVAAHSYSSAQLLKRFWRRNRAVLSMAGSALALLTLVIIAAFVKTDQERRFALTKQDEAQAAQRSAESAGQQATARADEMTLLQAHAALGRDPNEALAWLKTLSPSFNDAGEMHRIAEDARARGLSRAYRGHTAHVSHVTVYDGGKHFVTASDDKTLRVWDVATAESRLLSGHTDEAWTSAIFPGDERLVSISKDNTARVWDLKTGDIVSQVRVPGYTEHIVVRGDGTVVGASLSRAVPWVWKPGEPEVHVLTEPGEQLAFSVLTMDGRLFLGQQVDGTAFVMDVATAKRRPLGSAPLKLDRWCVSADGRLAVHGPSAADPTGKIELWNTETATVRTLNVPGAVPELGISPKGELIAVRGEERVDVIDTATGQLVRRFARPPSRIFKTVFSPDNRVLALGGFDETVRTWDLATGESRMFAGLKGFVSDIEFLPDQRSILASSSAGDVRLFEAARPGAVLTDHGAPASGFVISADGRVASRDERGHLWINDLQGNLIAEHDSGKGRLAYLITSPDKKRFAGVVRNDELKPSLQDHPASEEDRALLLGTFDASRPVILSMPATGYVPAWHPDGRSVFVALADRSVQRVDLGGARTEVDRLLEPIDVLAVSPDGESLAEGLLDGTVRIKDLKTGRSRELGRHSAPVLSLEFSDDGATLLSGSLDHTARIWRLADGTFRSIDAGGYGVGKLKLSPDQKTLYALSPLEPLVRRFDVSTGAALPSLGGHQGPVSGFELSADGRRVITWSQDRSVRVFDVATAKSRALVGHKDLVVGAGFAAGDKVIVALGREGTVRAWPDDLPETVPELRAWIDAATPDRIEKR